MDINTVDFPEGLTALPKLTPRQKEILELISHAIDESGSPPTRAEIANQLGFASANAAEEHLRALAKKGYIELTPGTSRGIRIPQRSQPQSIPPNVLAIWCASATHPAIDRPSGCWLTHHGGRAY